MQDDTAIRALFTEYTQATGLPLRYSFDYYTDLYLFSKRFKTGDISKVVRYLRTLYKDSPAILRATLRLSKLIRERDRFGEYLAEAEALERPKAPATKTVRYGNTERIVPNNDVQDTSQPARVPVEKVLAAMRESANDPDQRPGASEA